jgi:hypothetical protein
VVEDEEMLRKMAEKMLKRYGYKVLAAQHGVLEKDVNFIQKPFTWGVLAAKVRENLDRKQG